MVTKAGEITKRHVAIIGSGPAGLICAFTLASRGIKVSVFEKRKALGRKLLIAGSSGLNITYDCPASEFHKYYGNWSGHFEKAFAQFPPEAWITFIEKDLGIPTFKGTSRRYFVEGMKASLLLKTWTEKLKQLGVKISSNLEWTDIAVQQGEGARSIRTSLSDGSQAHFDAVCLALGGGSYEPTENPLRWPLILRNKGISLVNFRPSNVGFEVDWPEALLQEAVGKPIKNMVLTSAKGTRSGELVITRYGLEGTPIYFAGVAGTVYLDLKPGLDTAQLSSKLSAGKENLSPMRKIKKYAGLCEAALALFYHLAPPSARTDFKQAVAALKRFPVVLKKPRPLSEAISSTGGVPKNALTTELMLRKLPGVYCAGEMIDWDAPTGGFLIQGSVSQGYFAAQSILKRMEI